MIGFHEIRFPESVSWGSQGGPVFKTQVFTSHRGYEKRNIDWSQPIMQFNVAYGIRTDADILNVINFFNARQGKLFGFRYKNWCNFQIKSAPIATGDGYSKRLPMYKFYGFPAARHYKRIRKIVRGSVSGVSVGGEVLTEGVDFRIDYDAGEIVLNSAPGFGTAVTALTCEFDEPVRFDEDSVENVIDQYNNNALNTLNLVGMRGSFSAGSAFSPDLSEAGKEDPIFGRTFLLLNFDYTGDETSTKDHSVIANAMSFNGTAKVVTDAFRHGNAAFHAGMDGYLSAPGSSYQFGSKPFTIEMFAQRPTEGDPFQPIVSLWDATTSQRGFKLRYVSETQRLELVASENGTNERTIISHPWESTTGHFDYVSVDRLSSGWYVLRINGAVKQTVRDNKSLHASTAPLTIGGVAAEEASEGPFQGHIDSVRITSGYARNPGLKDVDIPLPYGVT